MRLKPTLTLSHTQKGAFNEAITNGTLRLIEGAIAPASAGDKIIFYANPTETVWGTTKAEWARRNENAWTSERNYRGQSGEIADVYRTYGIPFYLKIDVEGADRLVLEQLKLFSDRPHYVSLESEKVDFAQLKAELELLKSLGYTKFKLVQQQAIPGTKITTRALDGRLIDYVFEPHASGPFGADLPRPGSPTMKLLSNIGWFFVTISILVIIRRFANARNRSKDHSQALSKKYWSCGPSARLV